MKFQQRWLTNQKCLILFSSLKSRAALNAECSAPICLGVAGRQVLWQTLKIQPLHLSPFHTILTHCLPIWSDRSLLRHLTVAYFIMSLNILINLLNILMLCSHEISLTVFLWPTLIYQYSRLRLKLEPEPLTLITRPRLPRLLIRDLKDKQTLAERRCFSLVVFVFQNGSLWTRKKVAIQKIY